jgi:hypothetical protein
MPTPTYTLLGSTTISNTTTNNVIFSGWNTSYYTLFIWGSLSSNIGGFFDVPYWEIGDSGSNARSGRVAAVRYNDFDITYDTAKTGIVNVSYMSGSSATNVFGVNTWVLYNPNVSQSFPRVCMADGSQQSRASTTTNWSMNGYWRSDVTNAITQIKIYAPDGRTFLPNSTLSLYGVSSS